MTDEQVAYAVTKSTTTKAAQVKVLYNDGTRFLVKWPPGKDGRVFREHIPSWVMLYELPFPAGGDVKGKEVYSCDKAVNPALTAGVLRKLVVDLGLAPACIRGGKSNRTRLATVCRTKRSSWPLASPAIPPRPKPYTRHYPTY